MTHTLQNIGTGLLLFAALNMLASCAESSSDTSVATPAFEADTSYLDELSDNQGIDTRPAEQAQDETPEPKIEIAKEKRYEDEERHWVREDSSKSLFGRARDRAKGLGEQAQGSTEPENGLAITAFDEEYAQAAGFAWDMPEDWRMAVPGTGRFAEMYIQHRLGNASVSFTKETDSISNIKRRLESTITSTYSSRTSATLTKKTVMDFPVTILDLEGTYIDPGAKGTSNGSPFYAIHAVIIELPTTKVLIKLWGPAETVNQSKGKFDAMIEQMYER